MRARLRLMGKLFHFNCISSNTQLVAFEGNKKKSNNARRSDANPTCSHFAIDIQSWNTNFKKSNGRKKSQTMFSDKNPDRSSLHGCKWRQIEINYFSTAVSLLFCRDQNSNVCKLADLCPVITSSSYDGGREKNIK